jgi:ketosteroid isomerase-like protein
VAREIRLRRIVPGDDENAIRDLVDQWLVAGKAGDVTTLLDLMADH